MIFCCTCVLAVARAYSWTQHLASACCPQGEELNLYYMVCGTCVCSIPALLYRSYDLRVLSREAPNENLLVCYGVWCPKGAVVTSIRGDCPGFPVYATTQHVHGILGHSAVALGPTKMHVWLLPPCGSGKVTGRNRVAGIALLGELLLTVFPH
jgi:hypothetical protein